MAHLIYERVRAFFEGDWIQGPCVALLLRREPASRVWEDVRAVECAIPGYRRVRLENVRVHALHDIIEGVATEEFRFGPFQDGGIVWGYAICEDPVHFGSPRVFGVEKAVAGFVVGEGDTADVGCLDGPPRNDLAEEV